MATETPMKFIVDCATGAQTYVPLTAEEIAEREQMALQAAEEQAAREAAEAAKQAALEAANAKLAALGLTAEEIAALRG